MFIETIALDVRYALRGLRRTPLYAASVTATIGLGLGALCSAFTLVNAYLLKPIDLPNPHALFALSWDSATARRHRFTLNDLESIRSAAPPFDGLAAAEPTTVMQGGAPMIGLLVSGNYFQVLGGRTALGRFLEPRDAAAPGAEAVVVLSHHTWRSRFGADASIIGRRVALGVRRFEVVGVAPPNFGLTNEEAVGFWAPMTMAQAFSVVDPQAAPDVPALTVLGRLRQDSTRAQASAWLDTFLRRRFPDGSESSPLRVRVDSLATRIQLTGATLTLFGLVLSAFGLVLLVACANVTNLMLARALVRRREVAVRLSLGASRWHVARQLIVESLLLAVPASAVGLAITIVAARAFPALIIATFPPGIAAVETVLVPLDPDLRVGALLVASAFLSGLVVSLAPIVRMTRGNLAHASRDDLGVSGPTRSRLRTGLVAAQVAICLLFLVGADGLIDESRRLANPDTGLSYERVVDVRLAQHLRAPVADRLKSDGSVEYVAAAWEPPLTGPLPSIEVVASGSPVERTAGFMVVSSDYFSLFDIDVLRGRRFTAREADDNAPVVLVSAATALRFWPGQDPVGQTLDLVPPRTPALPRRLPSHTTVRVVGVTEDVVSGLLIEGTDDSCVYFPTGLGASGELSLLLRARVDTARVDTTVASAVNAVEPEAPFRIVALREMLAAITWIFQALSLTALFLGVTGLALAFSGTYAVVTFLASQRTREFGVRMALGATVRQIVHVMLVEASVTGFIGLAAGAALAAVVSRGVSSTLEIIPVFGLRSYVVAAAIVLTSTVAAALVPSLRAARIEPWRALRTE